MVEIHYKELNQNMQEKATGTLGEGFDDVSETDLAVLLKNNAPPNYMSFDGEGINLLNVNSEFLCTSDYAGYISNDTSDEYGFFLANSPSLYIECDEYLDFKSGITFAFYGNCCREFTVKYCFPDGTIESENVIVDSPLFHWQPSDSYSNVIYRLEIYFTKTVLPYQFLKISYIRFGKIKKFEKIKESNLLEQLTVLSDDIPINSLNFSVVVDEPIRFEENSAIDVYSNNKYYGTFYLDEYERIAKQIYSVKALSSIKKLDENEFKEWLIGMPTNNFIDHFKNTAGVNVKMDDMQFYHIDGHVEINSFRYALCLFAFACGLMIDESRNDSVILKSLPTEVSSVITTESKRIIGEAVYTQNHPVAQAKIREVLGTASGETTTLEFNNLANKRIVYYFKSPPCVAGFPYDDVTVYTMSDNYIEFVPSTEKATLRLEKYNYSYNDFILLNPNANQTQQMLDFSKFVLKANYYELYYGDDTTKDIFGQKLNDIIKYMQSGGTIKAKIVLDGEKVGDLIQIETAYDGLKTGIITSMSIGFGYRDVAEIEVLEWQIG